MGEERLGTIEQTTMPVFLQPEMLAVEPKRRNRTHEDKKTLISGPKRNSDITENIRII